MNQKSNKVKNAILITGAFITNLVSNVLATAPNQSVVESIAVDGIDLFFGSLGGIAIIFGGVEFWGAFIAYRENDSEGGSGEANSKIGKKVLAGILCIIGAVIIFVVMNWTKTLFNLD